MYKFHSALQSFARKLHGFRNIKSTKKLQILDGQDDKAEVEIENYPTSLRWTILHKPEIYFVLAAKVFKKKLEEYTDGKLTIDIILAPEDELQPKVPSNAREMILDGSTDIMQIYSSWMYKSNPKMAVLSIPYLFSTPEQVDKILDGDIGNELLQELKSPGLEPLGFTFSGGFMNFASKQSDIRNVSDLEGKTIYGFTHHPMIDSLYKKLGIKPIKKRNWDGTPRSILENMKKNSVDLFPLTAADAQRALKGGTINSMINSKHELLTTVLMINKGLFESLKPEHQEAVRKAAKEASTVERNAINTDGEKVLSIYSEKVSNISNKDKEFMENIKNEAISEFMSPEQKEFLHRIEKEISC